MKCPKDKTEMVWRICFGDSHWECPKCQKIESGNFLDCIKENDHPSSSYMGGGGRLPYPFH